MRDVEVQIGRRLVELLAGPLGLLLDSASWLANTLAERYAERIGTLADEQLATGDAPATPLLPLVMSVLPEFFLPELRLQVEPVEQVVGEFQQPWRRVIDPPPGRLRAANQADLLERCVGVIPTRHWPMITSRGVPPSALPSPRITYLTLGAESLDPPAGARVLPVAERRGGQLVVRCASDGPDGPVLDLLETLGDLLSALVATAFQPFPPAPHRPRVTVDRLVISRETWNFPATEPAWAAVPDEAGRFAAARRWRARAGLPERVLPGCQPPSG